MRTSVVIEDGCTDVDDGDADIMIIEINITMMMIMMIGMMIMITRVGEMLEVNCSSPASSPPAKLRYFINNMMVKCHHHFQFHCN